MGLGAFVEGCYEAPGLAGQPVSKKQDQAGQPVKGRGKKIEPWGVLLPLFPFRRLKAFRHHVTSIHISREPTRDESCESLSFFIRASSPVFRRSPDSTRSPF